jgi:putative ABC transport system permease protein
MLKLVLRGLAGRWREVILAGLAIFVGVAFVCGTLVLAESVRSSYARLVKQTTSGVDVYVRGPETDKRQGISDFAPVDGALLQPVRGVAGVAQAQGQVVRVGQLVTLGGTFLNPNRPTYVYSWLSSAMLSAFSIVAGRAPSAAGEIALDRSTAAADGLRLGDAVRVSVDVKSPLVARVTGLVQPTFGGDLTDASAVLLSGAWAQSVVGIAGRWDLLEVAAAPGIGADDLRARIAPILPDDGTAAITSRQYADAQLTNLARRSNSVTSILLALSLLALLVGSGIILNTFTILVAQRTGELSLLRTVGMSRRQAYTSVVGEAAILGLVASALGAAAAVPASYAISGLTKLSGATVNVSRLHVVPLTLVLAVVTGTLVTTAISTIPARRATRVRPLEAWRAAAEQPHVAVNRLALWSCAGLVVASAVTLLVGVLGHERERGVLVTIGGAGLAAGVVASLPVGAPALLGLMARCLGRWGASGAVAATNVVTQPRRAVAPAAAIVLGLGMVTCVSVFAASAHASIASLVRRADRADMVVTSDAAPGIDPEAVEKINEAPAVSVVSEVGADSFQVDGRPDQLTALDTDTALQVLSLPVVSGTLNNFGDGSIAVTRSTALDHNYHIGGFVQVRFGEPQIRYLRIDAIIDDNGITHDWVIPFETYRRGYLAPTIRALFIKGAPGADLARLDRQIQVGVAGFPGIQLYDAAAYAESQAHKAEGPIGLIQALVGLAILMALVGVMNALSLSTVERIPELGLLDVLGMTPVQVSLTVHWEALMIALLGVSFGIAAGVVLGVSLMSAASVHGIARLVVPAPKIALVALAVVGGALLAAVAPAHRASRLATADTVATATSE